VVALRFALFALLFAPLSLLAFALAALAELLSPGAVHWWRRLWAQAFVLLARMLLGIRLRVEGAAPRGGLVAARHESLYETIALMTLLPRPAVVLKRELARLPLWRFLIRRSGAVPLDRTAGASALRIMVAAARMALARGQPVLIFPEGTRVEPQARPPLQPGVSGLYKALARPVTPVRVHTGQVWPRRGLPRPGTALLAFGAPIPPGLPRDAFEARLRAAIQPPAGCEAQP
jgi:1-acyl-sn-glycerol-3-phosphate acyltransferase